MEQWEVKKEKRGSPFDQIQNYLQISTMKTYSAFPDVGVQRAKNKPDIYISGWVIRLWNHRLLPVACLHCTFIIDIILCQLILILFGFSFIIPKLKYTTGPQCFSFGLRSIPKLTLPENGYENKYAVIGPAKGQYRWPIGEVNFLLQYGVKHCNADHCDWLPSIPCLLLLLPWLRLSISILVLVFYLLLPPQHCSSVLHLLSGSFFKEVDGYTQQLL